MKFELLISTMHKKTTEVLEMLEASNVTSDVLVVVQTDHDGYEEIQQKDKIVRIIFSTQRGLSRSRNMAIKNSVADIVLLADDDLYYYDDFERIILEEFENNKGCDFIVFNVDNYEKVYPERKKKVFFHHLLGFASWQISFNRNKVIEQGVYFNEAFGTGSGIYNSGEENIFLANCYRYFDMIYVPRKILKRAESESSWFTGFDDKYLFDRGAIFYAISRRLVYLLIFQFAIRRKKLFPNRPYVDLIKKILMGVRDYKKRIKDEKY